MSKEQELKNEKSVNSKEESAEVNQIQKKKSLKKNLAKIGIGAGIIAVAVLMAFGKNKKSDSNEGESNSDDDSIVDSDAKEV